MATIDEVIEKVRKLRKLAGSDNVNSDAPADPWATRPPIFEAADD